MQTIAVVPAADHSYVLDTVSNPSAAVVVNQIVAMIQSFKPS